MKSIKMLSASKADIFVPPSKAHTLRALILASLCDGTSVITNPLMGEDQKHLISCLKALGVEVSVSDNTVTIHGTGGVFNPASAELNCGESGVAMNFLCALSPFASSPVYLTGKEGLLKRPVGEIVQGLRQLGADISYKDTESFPPLNVKPSRLRGGQTKMQGKYTSQYFSSLTIASALAQQDVEIICTDEMSEKPYYDITLEMMRKFGVTAQNFEYKRMLISSGQKYTPLDITIEGDYSSASYFFEAAAVCGIEVRLHNMNEDSVQGDKKIIDYMKVMGCTVEKKDGVLTVKGGELTPLTADCNGTPDLVPTLAVCAAFADGKSLLQNVAHLKFKECDRITAVCTELGKMGIKACLEGNDLAVYGDKKSVHASDIHSYNDHRIAMSFAVPGLILKGQSIDNPGCVAKSFPNFWEVFSAFSS